MVEIKAKAKLEDIEDSKGYGSVLVFWGNKREGGDWGDRRRKLIG